MKASLLLLLLALANGGCSYLTQSGRQQAAYARYIRHSSYARIKIQRKLSSKPHLPKVKEQSEPTLATSSGPESVTSTPVAQTQVPYAPQSQDTPQP